MFSSTIVSFGFSTIMSEESEDPTVSVVGVEVFDSVFSVGEIIGESPVSIFFFGAKLTPSLKSSI